LAVKVTLPPGVPAAAGTALTLAVKVTGDPKADREADEVTVIVVGARVTTTDSPASLHVPETGLFCASPE
jgi:archaellum component FlaG (FlaF/FlaG flagellin family)